MLESMCLPVPQRRAPERILLACSMQPHGTPGSHHAFLLHSHLLLRAAIHICLWRRHKHEIETGRTSSLSHHLLGYDAQDYVINYAGVAAPAPADIAADADKVWCVTGRAALQCLLMTHSEPLWL